VAERGTEMWEVWYPEAAATGLLVGRGGLDAAEVLWLHSAPEVISVRVRDEAERLVAAGRGLRREGGQLPMTRLAKVDGEVRREDRWPVAADLGALVLLPGGEVGTLVEWWNAEDGSEWRWRVEFYNHV